jgi:hypothetical protein
MMLTIIRILTLFFVFGLSLNNATASETRLTTQIIKSWVSSQNALEKWGKEHQSKLEAVPASPNENPSDMTPASMILPLKAAGLYESANNLIQTQGFKDIDEWASITLRITKAAAAIEFEAHPEMMNNNQLEALRSNDDISPEHKKMLNDAIKQNQEMVKQILNSTTQADKDAVKPHLDSILQLMEEPY